MYLYFSIVTLDGEDEAAVVGERDLVVLGPTP